MSIKRDIITFYGHLNVNFYKKCAINGIAMQRTLYQHLLAWQKNKQRKPLIVRGGRQVGKTYLLKTFAAQEYTNVAYLNFEQTPEASAFFQRDLNPRRILENLEIYLNIAILPEKTLIIFDEIQASPQALTSLKYFQEQANEYHIAAAGSLLGIKLAEPKSFPVGKVNFLDLYPLTFFEFLDAIGKQQLRIMLDNLKKIQPIPQPFHMELIELLKKYFFIGGMPEAVAEYSRAADFNAVRQIQHDILDAYLLDFIKHAPPQQVMKITTVWQFISSQLAKENKKFIFSALGKSARAREYETAIQWLVDARLIHQSFRISVPKLPVESYCDRNIFKVFLLDVGLLGAMNRLPPRLIIEGDDLFVEYKGAMTENFVAQELIAHQYNQLYYWTNDGKAEIDFVVHYDANLCPLEVKASRAIHSKSLKIYQEKYKPELVFRASFLNLKQEENLCNYPLYLLAKFPQYETLVC